MKIVREFIQQFSDFAECTVGFKFKTEGFGKIKDPCSIEAISTHFILTGQEKVLTVSPAISRSAPCYAAWEGIAPIFIRLLRAKITLKLHERGKSHQTRKMPLPGVRFGLSDSQVGKGLINAGYINKQFYKHAMSAFSFI